MSVSDLLTIFQYLCFLHSHIYESVTCISLASPRRLGGRLAFLWLHWSSLYRMGSFRFKGSKRFEWIRIVVDVFMAGCPYLSFHGLFQLTVLISFLFLSSTTFFAVLSLASLPLWPYPLFHGVGPCMCMGKVNFGGKGLLMGL